MSEAWLALIGTCFGGAGFKIIEHFLGRSRSKMDTATALRDELRKELTEIRKEADDLRDELDLWRTRYYSLVSSIASGDLREALRKISENK